MKEPKVFICIEEVEGKAEFIDWVVANRYEEVEEMYPYCTVEELPIELILQEIQEFKNN